MPPPETLSFPSHGLRLAAQLFTPSTPQPWPAVVVTGSWTSVKEQMPAFYARALAECGFAALCFDFRGWGQSPGRPPFLEDPERKAADIVAAFDYLASRPDIDPQRIAGLGICASAGYMARAVTQSEVPRALALVAPWLHDAEILRSIYGGEEGVARLREIGRRAAEAREPELIEAASTTNPAALMYQVPYYTEPARGLIPQYDNRFNLASWQPWLDFDAHASAAPLQIPTLLVHSPAAAIPQGAERFAKALGRQGRLVWLENVTQFDFYDQPKVLARVIPELQRHFIDTFTNTFAHASTPEAAQHAAR